MQDGWRIFGPRAIPILTLDDVDVRESALEDDLAHEALFVQSDAPLDDLDRNERVVLVARLVDHQKGLTLSAAADLSLHLETVRGQADLLGGRHALPGEAGGRVTHQVLACVRRAVARG